MLVALLIGRIVYLTVIDRQFLLKQGNARVIRTVSIPAHRGMILDRLGKPLAVTMAVYNIWVDPHDFSAKPQQIAQLANLLEMGPTEITKLINSNKKRQFLYLKRNLSLEKGKSVAALAIDGLYLQDAYRRYYPQGEMSAHVIGFTNIDNKGQEGLELRYNRWLTGVPGRERVIKDRKGHVVAILNHEQPAQPGHDLHLTLDKRLQYLAFTTLQQTVDKYKAESGSAVVLDPRNGQVLAMVNLPSYDPNNRQNTKVSSYRNRAVTDAFEPGSTMKTFSIASALASGRYTPDSEIDTGNGSYRIGKHTIHDDSKNGVISVTQILQKSSNIGAAKLTLSLPPAQLVNLFREVGFGRPTASGFPGEVAGYVPPAHQRWRSIELATLSFGYALTVTTLQLSQAYAIIANQGIACPITFIKPAKTAQCHRVMKAALANEMLTMLQSVIQKGGTGTRARLPDYTLAGKTGTAYIAKAHGGGYDKSQYMSSFVSIAPVTTPRLVVAVVIRKPQGQHFGAIVSAPAAGKIMERALHILGVAVDKS
ncbi:MAG: penicillin-binding protein 2 [Gammaproteobacteria bacterium]|nr:penicillin-binding protein 2 [Gammaproteobacteria bacterium]